MRQNTVGDYVGRSFAIFGLATPNFWLATIILVFPAIWWGWSPPLRLVRLSAAEQYSRRGLPLGDCGWTGSIDYQI